MKPRISPNFVRELQSVWEEERWADEQRIGEEGFERLADSLGQFRRHRKAKARVLVSQLPRNDPFRCPLSIFGPFDCGRSEAAHTRVLTWLLNPEGDHGFGDTLLRAPVQHVQREFAQGLTPQLIRALFRPL